MPPVASSAVTPRPYQLEALAALDAHVSTKTTNPCVTLPTGAGKSLVIAWAIQRWKSDYPPFRPDFCPGGRRIEVLGVYSHVFDPGQTDWRKRLEMKPIRVMAKIIEADGTQRFTTAATFAELTRLVAPATTR